MSSSKKGHANHHHGKNGIKKIVGSNGNDFITGGNCKDQIDGGNGNDVIDGGAGNDILFGGNGNDILRGGAGHDQIDGGNGDDKIIYRADATAGHDTVNGGRGCDTLVLELTAAQQASAAFLADKAAFTAYLAAGCSGSFNFTSISLTVTGGIEKLNIVTVTGPGGPVNTAPTVSGPVTLAGGVEDTATVISVAALLANASDAQGNALSVTNLQASSGVLVNNGNGTYTYTPAANANGLVTFTYSVSDSQLSTSTSASLNVAAVNDAPTAGATIVLPALAEDNSVTITAAQLLANAGDVDSASLSVVNMQASSGTLVNNGNGTYSYTPASNDDTSVNLTYQISDGQASIAGSASIDLTPVNDLPVFTSTSHLDIAIPSGLFGGGLIQATDIETPSSGLTYAINTAAQVQTLGFVGIDEVTGEYFYLAPEPDGATFAGLDQFEVTVTDADGGSTNIVVTVNVLPEDVTMNIVDGNSNRGGLLSSILVQDVFHFTNDSAVGVSSGVDYLTNFFSGDDSIVLNGNSFAAVDIIASEIFDATAETYSYTIADTGAMLISNLQLTASDFTYEILMP